MSTGLLQQLADYGAFHDEEQGYVEAEEVFATGDFVFPSDAPLQVARRHGNRPGVWVAVAAAVLTILLIGVIPFLVENDEPQPADTVVLTTAAESTPTTVAGVTPTTLGEAVPITGSWTRILPDEEVFAGEGHMGIGSVTVGGPGLVAVGGDELGGVVWTSVDGVTWSRLPHDESVFGGEGLTMVGVTAGGPGLVAVGWQDVTIGDVEASNAVVWASEDGIIWSRVPHDEEIFGSAMMLRVTAGGPGFVAVGMAGQWPDGDAAIWTSVDGLTWARVPHDEAVFGGADSQIIHDVTVGGPGLVAVGNDGGKGWWDNNPDNHPVVWTSEDGLHWSRVPDDEEAFGSGGNPVMLGVTAGGPGLVAVGGDWWPPGLERAPVWTSPDGINWTRVPDTETVTGPLTSVAAGGSGLVAVGNHWPGPETNEVWTSSDGFTWAWVPHDEEVFGYWPGWITDVTSWGSGFVAVGYDEEGVGAVWVSQE